MRARNRSVHQQIIGFACPSVQRFHTDDLVTKQRRAPSLRRMRGDTLFELRRIRRLRRKQVWSHSETERGALRREVSSRER